MRRWSRVAAFSLVCTVMAMPAMAQDTLSVVPTEAEPVEEPGLTGFGIIGGLSWSKLSLGDGNSLDNPKNRTAFAGGAFLLWRYASPDRRPCRRSLRHRPAALEPQVVAYPLHRRQRYVEKLLERQTQL